jgi:hypothetical protein
MGPHEPIYCRICGQPVDPAKDVMFGAAGKPLFAAHSGDCANKVKQGVGILGQTLQGLIRQKAPRAFDVLNTAVQLAGQVRRGE